jgi:glycosyltransferase involved in cell wall biosynthesis
MSSWEDSFPLVVLETMAMAIPVICFAPTGGPVEEVGDAGIVIPEISPHLMAAAIVDLAESPEKRQAIGIACAERVRERFPRAASLASLTELFDAAIDSHAGARGPKKAPMPPDGGPSPEVGSIAG